MSSSHILRAAALPGMGTSRLFGIDASRLVAGAREITKRGLDITLASLAILVLAPVFLALVILVRRDGGPAIFAHRRVGQGGRTFGCLKFRSMASDAEERLAALLASDPQARREWEEHRKLSQDPRVTPIGRFLRSSSLDELPQLLNVVVGDMSLVGPRPVTREELDAHYGPATAAYASVRPGVTGPWQIGGRSDTGYRQRVALDVAYASQPSLITDIRILAMTPIAVLSRRGAR